MFKVGDAVVHPVHGAGVVTDIEELRLHGSSRQYYEIELLGRTRTSMMVRVKDAEARGLRRAIEQSQLRRVWRVLCSDPKVLPADHSERYELLKHKLHAGDLFQVVEAVRDMVWWRRREGSLTTPGKRIYKEGMTLLAGEIAVAQGVDLTDAKAQVRTRLRESLSPRTAT
jgi:CarD family transcriptional regulator